MNTTNPSLKNPEKNLEKPSHIILVEDDADLLRMLSDFLQKNGFLVSACEHFEDLLTTLKNNINMADSPPDLFVLDLMLPDKNGIEISQYIRSTQRISTLPILILTAQDNELLEVTALNEGATSFLNKPVRPHVLLAHINALLNQQERQQQLLNKTAQTNLASLANSVPKSIGLALDAENLTATLDGELLNLSTAEFELLQLLYEHRGKTISRDFLMGNVRGMEYDGLNRSVDMRISTLRKKLGDHKPPYRFIKTIRGKGYLFTKDA